MRIWYIVFLMLIVDDHYTTNPFDVIMPCVCHSYKNKKGIIPCGTMPYTCYTHVAYMASPPISLLVTLTVSPIAFRAAGVLAISGES